MILRKFLDLLNFSETQAFCIHKLILVIMMRKTKNLVFVIFQIVVSNLNDFNNNQKLSIISFVSRVYKLSFLEKKILDTNG